MNSSSSFVARNPETNTGRESFVIGDIHGHLDRLEGLLLQEGLLEENHDSDVGSVRSHKDVEVILLGDVGHFGHGGSPTGDSLTWEFASDWADLILWGNHDRAVFDPRVVHSGFAAPDGSVSDIMRRASDMGKLVLSAFRHGVVLTHAGVTDQFERFKVEPNLKSDPQAFVDWVNEVSDPDSLDFGSLQQRAIRDAIGVNRGGADPVGGILWRDFDEGLFDGFPQIFGHSASRDHVVRDSATGDGACIDIGGKGDAPGDKCLAGVWLPSQEIARIDL